MEAVMAYYPHPAETGSGVDPRYGADGQLVIFGKPVYLEADRDTESREQFVAHMRRYVEHGCPGPVLVFTLDDPRRDRLIRWAEFLRSSPGHDEVVFFATVHEVGTCPYGEIWKGLDGHHYSVIQAVELDEADDV